MPFINGLNRVVSLQMVIACVQMCLIQILCTPPKKKKKKTLYLEIQTSTVLQKTFFFLIWHIRANKFEPIKAITAIDLLVKPAKCYHHFGMKKCKLVKPWLILRKRLIQTYFHIFAIKLDFFSVERNLIYSEKNDAIKTNGVVFCS